MQEQRALKLLEPFRSSTIKLGLDYITLLMKALGNPEDRLQIIHIGGTNGKGSTSQFIRGILQEAGHKVGVFSSPELISPRENIRINHVDINKEDFLSYTERVVSIAERMRQQGLAPSEFEILVAIGFLYFYEQKVDFVILEVGMGGRLDATNVISRVIMSIITKIAIDHTRFLGNTLAEIAKEKAGIIKENSLLITPLQEPEVMDVLEQVAKYKHTEMVVADPIELTDIVVTTEGTSFKLKGENFKIRMLGAHQAYNCMIAIEAIKKLEQLGRVTITHKQLIKGIKDVNWQGRFEKLSDHPLVFIDGAHNIDGFRALSRTINELPKCYTIGIMGVLKDKEVDQMVPLISNHFDKVIVTEPHNARALNKELLAEKLRQYGMQVEATMTTEDALLKALAVVENYKGNSQIIAFGSLYMIGTIRQHYLEMKS